MQTNEMYSRVITVVTVSQRNIANLEASSSCCTLACLQQNGTLSMMHTKRPEILAAGAHLVEITVFPCEHLRLPHALLSTWRA